MRGNLVKSGVLAILCTMPDLERDPPGFSDWLWEGGLGDRTQPVEIARAAWKAACEHTRRQILGDPLPDCERPRARPGFVPFEG